MEYDCKKHGPGSSPSGDCPKCLEEMDRESLAEEYNYGICLSCRNFEEGRCYNPKWKLGRRGMNLKRYSRKRCNGFVRAPDYDGEGDFDIEFDNGEN